MHQSEDAAGKKQQEGYYAQGAQDVESNECIWADNQNQVPIISAV